MSGGRVTARLRPQALAIGALTAGAALALKWHYAQAAAGELEWVLRPTAALVSLWTGASFDAQSSGYVSGQLATVIVPACAGINYLVVAFCMLAFGFRRQVPTARGQLCWVGASALLAYGATLVVNAARICAGIALRTATSVEPWISPEQAHRVCGIAVYLGSLWLLFRATECAVARLYPNPNQPAFA